jgi:hypothetical protein
LVRLREIGARRSELELHARDAGGATCNSAGDSAMRGARSSTFVCWISLALLLGGWSPPGVDGGAARSEERLLVLSRHSGEVLAGKDLTVHALEGNDARALADFARIESAAGRSPPRSAADLVVRLEDDRVIVNDPRTAVPPTARGDAPAEVQGWLAPTA